MAASLPERLPGAATAPWAAADYGSAQADAAAAPVVSVALVAAPTGVGRRAQPAWCALLGVAAPEQAATKLVAGRCRDRAVALMYLQNNMMRSSLSRAACGRRTTLDCYRLVWVRNLITT